MPFCAVLDATTSQQGSETLLEYLLPAAMFIALFGLIFTGFPVAFVLGGVGIGFAGLGIVLGVMAPARLFLSAPRIWGSIGDSLVLVAVPMFIFMGTMLERSGVVQGLMDLLHYLLRRVRGGLSYTVVVLGAVLAATTGIVGASVVMTALLALPMMLRNGYNPSLAAGTIAASGTLGIIIPPSIMLVIMADMLSISVGDLFLGALLPGLLLPCVYLIFLAIAFKVRPGLVKMEESEHSDQIGTKPLWQLLLTGLVPPIVLIGLVLGSIFGGFATPTEASGVGALGAVILAAANRRLTWRSLTDALRDASATIGMVFMIFVGATIFAYVFRLLGGEHAILELLEYFGLGPWGLLSVLLLTIFIMGFFFDWIEIALIIFPIFGPIIAAQDFGNHVPQAQVLVWFAVLVAINLQTSYLTPPFGFALFYLRGVAPPELKIGDIYRGVIPFVFLQLLVLILAIIFPQIILWLPQLLL